MKKFFSVFSVLALILGIVSCDKNEQKTVQVTIQLMCDSSAFATADIPVVLSDANATYSLESVTDAAGKASFKVLPGLYKAEVNYKAKVEGGSIVYNGSNESVTVGETPCEYNVELMKVTRSQIIIKELYCTGCPSEASTTGYSNDGYVILYNNSDTEADASDIVFTFAAPYNGNGTNKYYGADGKLSYENQDWIPSFGAIWWFQDKVVIPPYSQIVVAFFGGINHTATIAASVNLANPEYYLMSNSGISQYVNTKYVAGEVIPSSHYLTCSPFTQGNAWALSNASPAFYIAKMSKAEAKRISEDTEAYDHTLGTLPAFNVVKMPKSAVVDAVEVWSAANVASSKVRFSADVNTGHVDITNKLGYSIYRVVDEEETMKLPENEGKIVKSTTTVLDSTAEVIDAEASIAAGAHIIYSDTNNSSKDFVVRPAASLKK